MAYVISSAFYAENIDIRSMVKETIKKGLHIDRLVDGSNTLLHLAVQNDLLDCVVKLLSAGAAANIPNGDGLTARDLALDNGNQILLQVLGRREEYTLHLRLFNRSSGELSSENSNNTNTGLDHLQILASIEADMQCASARMIPLSVGAVYDDYLDWTDSQRCSNLQVCFMIVFPCFIRL
jgi:hypothetical protein